MKQYLLAAGLTVGVVGVAQAQQQAPTLPVDSATHKIAYAAVVQAPEASKADLYGRALRWLATAVVV